MTLHRPTIDRQAVAPGTDEAKTNSLPDDLEDNHDPDGGTELMNTGVYEMATLRSTVLQPGVSQKMTKAKMRLDNSAPNIMISAEFALRLATRANRHFVSRVFRKFDAVDTPPNLAA